jgi:hypothetical protein
MSGWCHRFLRHMLQVFFTGAAPVASTELRVYLIDTAAHAPSLANDEFLADIPAGARLTYRAAANVSVSAQRVVSADNMDPAQGTAYPDPGGGAAGGAFAYVLWTGAAATSRIVAYQVLDAPYYLDGTDDKLTLATGFLRLGDA